MTAHKHAKLIKAKADNMELVVFTKSTMTNKWEVTSFEDLVKNEDFDFFLCLPKHKEACLHWLNGGKCESDDDGCFGDLADFNVYDWCLKHHFISNDNEIRIKPCKEKRWIAVKRNDRTEVYTVTFNSLDEAIDTLSGKYWQFIEIEVEV